MVGNPASEPATAARTNWFVLLLSIGLGLGTGVGAACGNVGLGMAIGIAIGSLLGVGVAFAQQRAAKPPPQ